MLRERLRHACLMRQQSLTRQEARIPAPLALPRAQVYRVFTGKVTQSAAPNPLEWINTMALLPEQCAILAVGSDASYSEASAALYDTASGNWSLTGGLITGRTQYNLNALGDGSALVCGGVDGNEVPLASSELYNPASGERPLDTLQRVVVGGLPEGLSAPACLSDAPLSTGMEVLTPELTYFPAVPLCATRRVGRDRGAAPCEGLRGDHAAGRRRAGPNHGRVGAQRAAAAGVLVRGAV